MYTEPGLRCDPPCPWRPRHKLVVNCRELPSQEARPCSSSKVRRGVPAAKPAVDDVSREIGAGGFIRVIGRSTGSRRRPRGASASEKSMSPACRVASRRARRAMIFQQFNLVGRLDVLTHVLMGRLNHTPTLRAVLQPWLTVD